MNTHRERILDALARYSASQEPKQAKPRRPRQPSDVPTEYQEQRVVCDWLKANRIDYFAVPNGAHLSDHGPGGAGRHARQLAMVGMKRGVPDLIIVKRARNGKPTALEMKRTVGGRLSEEQVTWHNLLASHGWNVIVGKGADDAIEKMRGQGYGL